MPEQERPGGGGVLTLPLLLPVPGSMPPGASGSSSDSDSPTIPEPLSLLSKPGPSAQRPESGPWAASSGSHWLGLGTLAPRSASSVSPSAPHALRVRVWLVWLVCVTSVSTLAFPTTRHLSNQLFILNPLYENTWYDFCLPDWYTILEIPGSTVERTCQSAGSGS